ncbi:MAG: hypothetical protein U5Q44_00360 [Dehalococcoidia bacterium]|nr:hypothetical protein [Dehalococcoidia bacterium]
MSDLVIVLDREGTIVRIPPSNPRPLFGLPMIPWAGRSATSTRSRRPGACSTASNVRSTSVRRRPLKTPLPVVDARVLGAQLHPWAKTALSGWRATSRSGSTPASCSSSAVTEDPRAIRALAQASRNVAFSVKLELLITTLLSQLYEVVEHDGSAVTVLEGDELVFVDSRGFGQREEEFIGVRLRAEASPAVFWDRLGAGRNW